jgi:hypothetical protein
MKICIITMALFLFAMVSKAQLNQDQQQIAAGHELKIASKHLATGAILVVGGVFVSQTPYFFKGGGDFSRYTFYGSTAFYLAGAACIIESFSHLGKAGDLLTGKSKLSFGDTGSGNIGLSYNF